MNPQRPDNSHNGYTIYELEEEENHHRLFTVRLNGFRDPPDFYAEYKGTAQQIINEFHDYRQEYLALKHTFGEVLCDQLASDNYVESLELKLAISADDLQRQLDSRRQDHCFIARRRPPQENELHSHRQDPSFIPRRPQAYQLHSHPQDHRIIARRPLENEYAFHISGCDVYLSMGDKLIAVNHAERAVYRGLVRSVTLTEIVAKMPRQFVVGQNRRYEILFEHRWLPFILQKHCLDHVYNTLGESVLLPTQVVDRPPLVEVTDPDQWPWHNPQMNANQKAVVLNALKGVFRPTPYLISGPPGTGKTSTMVEYLHQVYKHNHYAKILICTPSNTAANVVLNMLRTSRWINVDTEVIRMLSYSYILSEDLPNHLRRFSGTLPSAPSEAPPPGLTIITTADQLKNYRIVISTVNYAGNFLRMGLAGHFTHLVVDEAGQALETEMLIPFSLMQRNSHLTLFGDEKQLGPIVLYLALQKMHFDVSMFERLSRRRIYFEQEGVLYSRLIHNYRSVPHLLRFYNELFYQERLIAMITDGQAEEFRLLDRLNGLFPPSYNRTRYQGLYFFCVRSDCFKDPETLSWYNPGEIDRLMAFYVRLLDNNVRRKQIGIVTPYRAQQREILQAFARMNLLAPKVGTVEVFQGDERMVMLMSPVRSFVDGMRAMANISLGFVNNPKRINVAISRGRALLVIFGNDVVLSGSEHWQRLITMAASSSTLIR